VYPESYAANSHSVISDKTVQMDKKIMVYGGSDPSTVQKNTGHFAGHLKKKLQDI